MCKLKARCYKNTLESSKRYYIAQASIANWLVDVVDYGNTFPKTWVKYFESLVEQANALKNLNARKAICDGGCPDKI